MWQQGLLAAHGRRGGGGELANTPATLTCTHAHPPAAQDVWVNNAALSQGVRAPLANTPATELAAIVDTNLVGGWVGGLLLLAWVLTFTHAPPLPPTHPHAPPPPPLPPPASWARCWARAPPLRA